jgi:hypothetical protein
LKKYKKSEITSLIIPILRENGLNGLFYDRKFLLFIHNILCKKLPLEYIKNYINYLNLLIIGNKSSSNIPRNSQETEIIFLKEQTKQLYNLVK